MPRIQPIDPADAPAAAKPMLDGLQAKLGRVPNIFKTMALAPATLEMYMGASGAMAKTSLHATLREQIAIACAGATGCDYCASAHSAIGRNVGLSDTEVTSALHGKSSDSKAEVAMNFARTLASNPAAHVTDEQVNALRTAGYSDAQILELVAVTALNLYTNMFNHVVDTVSDFEPFVSTAGAAKAA
jgi:uncharacterized peroxidase-related enzyme